MHKSHICLVSQDREDLQKMLSKGSLKSRTYQRITALLALDKGLTYEAVEVLVHLSSVSLGKLAKKYRLVGLQCLYDEARSGRPIKIQAEQNDQITLLACSPPPQGHSQWSLRLLSDKIVELGYCESISHTQVNKALKKRKLSPT